MNPAIKQESDAVTKARALCRQSALLKDEALQLFIRSLSATMPYVHTGTVTIELNFHEGKCGSASVGFKTRQVLNN